MQTFKKITLFCIINILITSILFCMLNCPTHYGVLVDEFKSGDYNEVILGQSHAQRGYNPYILSDGDSNKVFNLSEGILTLDDIYNLLKDINKEKNIKRVYLDLDSIEWNKGSKITYSKEGRDSNTNTIWHLSLKNDFISEYILRVMYYMNFNHLIFDYRLDLPSIKKIDDNITKRIKLKKNIDENDYLKENETFATYIYKGRGFLYGTGKNEWEPAIKSFSEKDVSKRIINYFKKIVNYCNENDIELICITSALPIWRLESENQDEAHKYFKELCEKENVRYIDLNYAKSEFLYRTGADYVDKEGHMMGSLANKQTELLKDVLNSNNPEQYFYDTYDEVLEGLKVKNGDAA